MALGQKVKNGALASPRALNPSRAVELGSSFRAAWLGSLAVNVATMLIGMITGVLAARLLGPEDRGVLAFVQFWPSLVTAVASLSLSEAVIRWHALAHRREALVATALSGAGLTALAALSFGPLLPIVANATGRSEWSGLLLAYHVCFVPLMLGSNVLFALDQAAQCWKRFNYLRLIPYSSYLIGIILLWATDLVRVTSLNVASLVGVFAVFAIQLFLVRGKLLRGLDLDELKRLLVIGARFHIGNLLALVSSHLDRLWLVLFFDDRTLGYFVTATTFASSGIGAIVAALQLVLFPTLAIRAVEDPLAAKAGLAIALQQTTLFMLVACAVAALVMPSFVPMLFGEAFAPAGWPAAVLTLAQIPLCLRQTALRSVRAFGDARTGAISELVFLLSFPLLAPWLGAFFGLTGIAGAVMLANAVGLLPVVVSLARRHGIAAHSWLIPSPTMIRNGWALVIRLAASVVAR